MPTKVSDLQNDSDFASNDDVFEALDGALSGNNNNEPALLIDDTVDQTSNPNGNIILYSRALPSADSPIGRLLRCHRPLCIRHRERRDRAAFAF